MRKSWRQSVLVGLLMGLARIASHALPPLLPEPVVEALVSEISGESAKRTLESITTQHRMRGSAPYHMSLQLVVDRARAYGLADARIESFPADGKIFYGTQRSRPAWDAEFAELWEMHQGEHGWTPGVRVANWEAQPISLAQDSEAGTVEADLVDVGTGSEEADYASKDVRGKLVLVSGQPMNAQALAVGRYGAVGLVSSAQNQPTAWSGEDQNLVRWGHLKTFSPVKTFAFMVSLKQAKSFRDRLSKKEQVRLKALVRAGQHPGNYELGMATITGRDPSKAGEEIVFTCHLDHPRPGANDNASGAVAVLEVARSISKLISEKRLVRPRRTLRFVWGPEVEGSLTLLNARPDIAARIRAGIHLDMVGGGPNTKAVFRVTRGPASLPSFVYDVGEAFGRFVNEETLRFASGLPTAYPLAAPEGGKEPLLAQMDEFTMGSDHEVYTERSWGIPMIYLNDWPDRYIHTNFDLPANIDPTKLKRAAFIAAASGLLLAGIGADDAVLLASLHRSQALRRTAQMLERARNAPTAEANNLVRFHLAYERAVAASGAPFGIATWGEDFLATIEQLTGKPTPAAPPASGAVVYIRDPAVRGPMQCFGYNYLHDHLGEEATGKLAFLKRDDEMVYDSLNWVDGRRTVPEIRDAIAAAYQPFPVAELEEYYQALAKIGVIRRRP